MKKRILKVADLFCGAGGFSDAACEAAEAAGYEVDHLAINHWHIATETLKRNHPTARVFCTGVDDVNPRDYYKEGELDLLLASPECTNHSNAKGGRPINDQSRSTAWCVTKWAAAVLPKMIIIENVPEFRTWGPLIRKRVKMKIDVPVMGFRKWKKEMAARAATKQDPNILPASSMTRKIWKFVVEMETKEVMKLVWMPDPKKKGQIYEAWKATLQAIGYKLDVRVVCSADYGDPTTRRRLMIIAVFGGRKKIVWANHTHTEKPDMFVPRRWRAAREIIDMSIKGTSIYERDRPLSAKTMARIWAGIEKFTDLAPFIVPQQSNPTPKSVDEPLPTIVAEGSGPKLVTPFLVPQFGERDGQDPRTHGIDVPLPTVTSHGAGALVQPYIVAWDNQSSGSGGGISSINDPISTVVTKARHGIAEPFLLKLRGSEPSHIENSATSIDDPLDTVTTKDRHALVRPIIEIQGNRYVLDIYFRMLQPHELARGMGFRRDYQFTGNKTQQVKQIGNAVTHWMARALIYAMITQQPDVTLLVEAEEQREREREANAA